MSQHMVSGTASECFVPGPQDVRCNAAPWSPGLGNLQHLPGRGALVEVQELMSRRVERYISGRPDVFGAVAEKEVGSCCPWTDTLDRTKMVFSGGYIHPGETLKVKGAFFKGFCKGPGVGLLWF